MIGLQPESTQLPEPNDSATTDSLTRAECLETAKRQAMHLILNDWYVVAYAQFCCDLVQHPELGCEVSTLDKVRDGLELMRSGKLGTRVSMAEWVQSFT